MSIHESIDELAATLHAAADLDNLDAKLGLFYDCQKLFAALVPDDLIPCNLSATSKKRLADLVVTSRYNKYKASLTAKVAYIEYTDVGTIEKEYREDIVEKLDAGHRCPGPYEGVPCEANMRFDKISVEESSMKEVFERFEFDHSYEQSNIKKSIDHAVKQAVAQADVMADRKLKAGEETGTAEGAIKRAISEMNKSKLAKKKGKAANGARYKLYMLVSKYIDIDLIARDLYSPVNGNGGIRIVCANCHKQAPHGAYDKNRYVIKKK